MNLPRRDDDSHTSLRLWLMAVSELDSFHGVFGAYAGQRETGFLVFDTYDHRFDIVPLSSRTWPMRNGCPCAASLFMMNFDESEWKYYTQTPGAMAALVTAVWSEFYHTSVPQILKTRGYPERSIAWRGVARAQDPIE